VVDDVSDDVACSLAAESAALELPTPPLLPLLAVAAASL
jgi:hypothetical protein